MSTISIPGFSNVMNSRLTPIKRLQWAAAMVFCFVMCVYHTKERIETYFKRPIILANEYQSQEQSPISFPLITLCPQEPFNNKVLYNMRLAHKQPNGTMPSVADLLHYENINLDHLWKLSGFQYNSYINLCLYSGGKPCTENMFWKETNTFLGKCNTLNIKNSTWFHGPAYGIILHVDDFWFDLESVHEKLKTYNIQLRLLLHNNDDDIRYIVANQGRFLYRNTIVVMAYTQTTVLRVNSLHRPCKVTKEVTVCIEKCYDDFALRYITPGCRLPFMRHAAEYPDCSSDQLNIFFERSLHYAFYISSKAGCEQKCGPPCSLNRFDGQPDGNEIPDDMESGLIRIYPTRNGVSIWREKITYSIYQLFCDFGAMFGMYLGISLLTFAEIGEYLTQFIIKKIRAIFKK